METAFKKVMKVSIHASAREATASADTQRPAACVSIHASAREATFGVCDDANYDVVSIHASAREATPRP